MPIRIKKTIAGNHIVTDVFNECESGESWTAYTVIPRAWFIAEIRKRYEKKRKEVENFNPDHGPVGMWGKMILPRVNALELAYRFLRQPHWGGPGRPYCCEPWVMRRNKRFIVIVQSGGWDV